MNSLRIRLTEPFPYALITQHCYQQIMQFMFEASRRKGTEAQYRRERAYSVWMGWRALVAERVEPEIFFEDERCLEQLLKRDLRSEA